MKLYITDKTGKKFFNTSVSVAWSQGERNNLNRHLQAIKAGNKAYANCKIDPETARIVEELDKFDEPELIDEELLAELGAP